MRTGRSWMLAAALALLPGLAAAAGWRAEDKLIGTHSFRGVAYEQGGTAIRLLAGPGTMYIEAIGEASGAVRQARLTVDGNAAQVLSDCRAMTSGRTLCRSNDRRLVEAVASAFRSGSTASLELGRSRSTVSLDGFSAAYAKSDLASGPGPAPEPRKPRRPKSDSAAATPAPAAPAAAPKPAEKRPRPASSASLRGGRDAAPPRPQDPLLDIPEGMGDARLIDLIRPMIRPQQPPAEAAE